MFSFQVAIAAHAKELLISFTGLVDTGLVTDRSDLFEPQVGMFPSVKVSTFGGTSNCGAFGPLWRICPK